MSIEIRKRNECVKVKLITKQWYRCYDGDRHRRIICVEIDDGIIDDDCNLYGNMQHLWLNFS